MRTTSIRRLGLLAAALCAGLSAPASAQVSTTANGPYFAMPSWSQQLTINRFVILANWNGEAVLDRETGLVWERAPDTTPRNWSVARSHCIASAAGGRKGWRLPSIQELSSLVDPSIAAPGPPLPVGHPFNVDPGLNYWSATIYNGPATEIRWVLSLSSGNPNIALEGASTFFGAWCVRGATVAEIQ
jgi:hypothetical protein